MDFIDLVKTRQSCRKYSGRAVEKEKLQDCLEAARLAPSANNSQPWKYIVIDEPELREKAMKAAFGSALSTNHFAMKAPVLIAIVTNPNNIISLVGSQLQGVPYRLIDVGISAEHFCLRAAELGMGTCMIGLYNQKKLGKALNLPGKFSVDLLISLGYPKEGLKIRDKKRKSLDKITIFNPTLSDYDESED